MRNRKVIKAAAVTTLLGSVVLALLGTVEFPPAIDRARHAAIGRAMAREALKNVKPGAGVVAIVRDTAAFAHPESDAQFRAFRDTLRTGGSSIAVIQSIQVDPLRPLEVPPGDFYEQIRKAPAGTAIVSFMGPPNLSAEQRARLGEIRPRILAFCPGALPRRTDLRSLFEAGLLHAALVEQDRSPTVAPGAARPGPDVWFEGHYRFVHAAEAASLPEYDASRGAR